MLKVNIKLNLDTNVDSVWKVITDNRDYAWRSDVKKIEIKNDKEFVEYDKNGFETFFTITCMKPNARYEFDLHNKNLKGHWTGILIPNAKGCLLDFTEEIEVKNVFMKLMAKFFLKKQQNIYI